MLCARARYTNQAEADDELTFQKDDILQVVEKDYKGQVDWWLCRSGNKTGMVPANYLEVYHQHTPAKKDTTVTGLVREDSGLTSDTTAAVYQPGDYALPKPNPRPLVASKSFSPPATIRSDATNRSDIPSLHELELQYPDYDIPKPSSSTVSPVGVGGGNEDIYDMPPGDDERDYDLPPADNPSQSYPQDIYDRPPSNKSSRSAHNTTRPVSTTSAGSSQIYDLPPTSPSALYDTPPADMRSSTPLGRMSRRSSGDGMDLSKMFENEADDFLRKSKTEIEKEFENLWQCVYGDNAYWGSDNKTRRKETIERTITAARKFDTVLTKLVSFSKGVVVSLENSSTKDLNFKKKCLAANTVLINKRQEVVLKIEQLLEADDTNVTAVVKSLLEVARNSPQAAQVFLILVQANKAILFKSSGSPIPMLPILTKTEVKNRPLPEIPQVSRYGKVFSTAEFENDDDQDYDVADDPKVQSGDDWTKKRRPQDDLPPLPFATLRKSSKKSKSKSVELDYDDIDGGDGNINGKNDHLRVNNSIVHARNHLLRQSSGSNSSDGGTSSPKRSRSPVHTNPYGLSSYERSGSPQPPSRRQEDRELLIRYSQQMELLVPGLKDAIEIFLTSVKTNDIPRVFVTKSKLAVVAAYKLVYIADALYQKVYHNDTKQLLVTGSNQLTESIKELVANTKAAALQYPHVGSMESMLISLRKLFPSALDLVNIVKSPPPS